MRKKVFIVFSCIFLIYIMTGCNANNQGAEPDPNDNYERIGYTADGRNVIDEREGRFPFNIFRRGDVQVQRGEIQVRRGDQQIPLEDPNFGNETEIEQAPEQEAQREERGQPQREERAETQREEREEPQTEQANEASSIEQEVIRLTNQEREKNGLSPLQSDSELAKVAQAKSKDMVKNNYFAHNSPTYGSPFNMLNDFGISYTAAAENIAAGQGSAKEVVQAWMNSEGHRKNILNKEVTHIGVGYEENGNHWTQLFIGK